MSDKAMPLGKKFKVRLTITPEETGTPVDMLGFTFTSGKNGHTTLNAQYSNIPKLVDDGLDSLSILVILKTLEMWAQKGYELLVQSAVELSCFGTGQSTIEEGRAAYQAWLKEHDRQIAEKAWEEGYIQAVKNMNPMPGEESPEYTPNPYRKENA